MYPIKQSTAITVPFFVHDVNGDAVTGLTDGSFTKRISKNGAAFAAMTVTITEMENGWYSIPLSTAHSDTLGLLTVVFTNAGAKQVNLQWRVEARILDDLAYPTVSGRSLDVTATGAAGIDWGNVENPATAVDLSATDIQLCDTVTTLTGHTAQTGDSFARLGAPAGASVSADVAAVKAETALIVADTNELQTDWVDGGRLDLLIDAILLDTGTTLDNHLTDIKGTGFVKDTHSLVDIEGYVDLIDDGTSGLAKIATDAAAILVDTGTTLPGVLGTPAGADMSADIAAVKTDTAATLADTGTDGVVVAAASKTGYQLSATGVDDILDEAYEGTTTLRQFLRLAASALFGKLSGAATTTVTIRDEADGKDRITATVDSDGNRSAVTLDKT